MATAKSNPIRATTTVMLVDDHPLVRQGMRQTVERSGTFSVVAEASTAAEAMALVREHQPDIAIIDITLEDTSGLELVKDLRAMYERVKIIVASMHEESLFAERAMKAGALAYINKSTPADQLIEAIKRVAKGRVWVSSALSERLLRRMVDGAEEGEDDPVAKLSDRELEVFIMIGQGVRTREIAERLCLSVKTIDTYRENIKAKLGVDHGTELIHYAVKWRLTNENVSNESPPEAPKASGASD